MFDDSSIDVTIYIDSDNEETTNITLHDSDNKLSSIGNVRKHHDENFVTDELLTTSQKQAAYYEQDCSAERTIKPMLASELRTKFNEILSNYDTCTKKMKLIINYITLSLDETTQTDGQSSGIFRHMEREKIDKDYVSNQTIEIIRKHNNSFLPTKGAFNNISKESIKQKYFSFESTHSQVRRQKRMRIMYNKERLGKKIQKKHMECILTKESMIEAIATPCIVN